MKSTVFRTLPPKELLEQILTKLHRPLSSRPCQVSKEELQAYQWGDELVELLPFYIPSMIHRFFDRDTMLPFQTSTILRHLLRVHGYTLVSKETMTNYTKTITYTVCTEAPTPVLDEEVVVSFT